MLGLASIRLSQKIHIRLILLKDDVINKPIVKDLLNVIAEEIQDKAMIQSRLRLR